jgi:flagellar motility protein MotE (MotC chaperone)
MLKIFMKVILFSIICLATGITAFAEDDAARRDLLALEQRIDGGGKSQTPKANPQISASVKQYAPTQVKVEKVKQNSQDDAVILALKKKIQQNLEEMARYKEQMKSAEAKAKKLEDVNNALDAQIQQYKKVSTGL